VNRVLLFLIFFAVGWGAAEFAYGYPAPKMRTNDGSIWNVAENRDHLSCFLLFSTVSQDPETLKELEENLVAGRSPSDVKEMVTKMVPQIRRRWLRLRKVYGLTQENLNEGLDKIMEALEFTYNANGHSWVPYLLYRWDHCSEYSEEVIK